MGVTLSGAKASTGIIIPKARFIAIPSAREKTRKHLDRYGSSWNGEPLKYSTVKKVFDIWDQGNVLSKIDQMCFMGFDESQSLFNWVGIGINPTNNGMPFDVKGFEGDGAAAYIDTGFNPSTASNPLYLLNSAHAAVFISDNAGPQDSTNVAIGAASGSSRLILYPQSSASNTSYRINTTSTITFGGNPYHGKNGLMLMQRSGAVTTRLLHDGNVIHAQSGGNDSTDIPTGNLTIGANVSLAAYGSGIYGGWSFGRAFSVSAGEERLFCEGFRMLAKAFMPADVFA